MGKTPENRKPISEIGKQSRLRWDDARVFLAIARAGTLSGAAARMGAGLATVSRRIERLEVALGLTLFSRHQSGYRLTDDGAALLERAEALEEAAAAFAEGSAAQSAVAGRVRLATAEMLANEVVIPALPGLLRRYPDLTLEIVTDVSAVNLHRREADLAVRMVKPERGNVTVRRLGGVGFGLYASRGYADAREERPGAAPFASDRFIAWSEAYGRLAAAQWVERTLRGRAPALVATTLSAQLAAVSAGIGIAVLPHFLADRHDLICLKRDLGADQEIWLAIHAGLARSRRVRVVSEYLADLIQRAELDRP